jgi:SAM-dependent methyltransferase
MITGEERMKALERLRPWIERARKFSGWFGLAPFPDFRVRLLEPGPQWDYESLVREMACDATAVLDLGTGGGEFVADVRDSLPARVVATEEWHMNAPVAYRTLTPLGVGVVRARSPLLPFRDEMFDLVFDRHEELSPAEVARVLRPGGRAVTQQVGPENWIELRRYFPSATEGNRSRMTDFGDIRGQYASGFESAGLTVTRDEAHDYKAAYGGLGEMVFMLLVTPWTIPDFDVERDLEALLTLEAECSTGDGLVMTWSRFLLVAEKAARQTRPS